VADAIFLRSDDGKLVDANQQACDSLGYTRHELLGMTPRGFVDPTVDESLNRWIGDQLKAGAVFSFESRHRRKDGTVFPVEVRVRPFWKGGRQFSLASVRDITERKQAEAALRQSERQLRDVIETIPAMAWTTRPDGKVDFSNKRWQEYTGISAREAIGFGWQTAIHPNDIDWIVEKRSASRESGTPFEGEVRILSRDGEYRWFLCRATPLRDERGNVLSWYGTATDIDERKRAEERLQRENVVLREEIDRTSMFEEIVGTSPALQKVLTAVSKVASADSTVLIVGETGTGKELVARAIHKKSPRSARAFVTVNCAAIPQSLIASELFGHEKGAFTGALQRRLGRFELAEGARSFSTKLGTQIALLRVLQERELQRVGGNQAIRLNVRVLAATNRDLQKATATGAFRQDLYYRLNVFPIPIPPLRERKQDIPLLVEYFIDRFSRDSGKTIRSIDKASLELCKSYSWPGNIRELQNVIERAVIICETETLSIDASWLPQGDSRTQTSSGLGKMSSAEERELIEEALTETEGRVAGPSGAAAKLGIPPSTLEYKIRLLKINKHQFKNYLRNK
jgi:PAS domain S-box-containing protein